MHYLEEVLLPVVETARLAVYGNQPYSSALSGCDSLERDQEWVHPTTLALTVYGDAQVVLEDRFGRHGLVEVLPKYREVRRGNLELRCVADYLLEAGDQQKIGDRRTRAFPFSIPYEKYGLSSGWVSGLTQGLVGQILLAAYLTEGDEEYLIAAREAGQLLAIDVESGGVRVEMLNGGAWYAEYAQQGVRPPLVLNGHLLALDFLYWMKQIEGESDWDFMFDSGLQAAVEQVNHYRGIGWSYYDRESNLATRKYQSFHVRQLDRYSMHDETGALGRARDDMQWQLFLPLGIFQRILTQPSRMLLFLITTFFVAYFPAIWFAHQYWSRKSSKTIS